MIFYQTTLDSITTQILIDAIHKSTPKSTPLHFELIGSPDILSLSDALNLIENKRITLSNPYNHTFLCIEFLYDNIDSISTLAKNNKIIANALNAEYDNDLFIISYIYKDTHEQTHAILCISDIEKSLPASSLTSLPLDVFSNIFAEHLSEYYFDKQLYDSLYTFNGVNNNLPYDGIVHVKAVIQKQGIIPS